MKISVVIPTLAADEALEACLQSLASQQASDFDFETIVVDNSGGKAQARRLTSDRVRVIENAGGNVVLTWPTGTLQQSTNAAAFYTDVVGATSPYTNAITAGQKYFRVKVQ